MTAQCYDDDVTTMRSSVKDKANAVYNLITLISIYGRAHRLELSKWPCMTSQWVHDDVIIMRSSILDIYFAIDIFLALIPRESIEMRDYDVTMVGR